MSGLKHDDEKIQKWWHRIFCGCQESPGEDVHRVRTGLKSTWIHKTVLKSR